MKIYGIGLPRTTDIKKQKYDIESYAAEKE